MAETAVEIIEPDLSFARRVMENGGGDVEKCFQCGSCSVVCEISPDNAPFPRKEMIWAQWGLSEKLLGDMDVWLCHQCDDCSAHCPRSARPSDTISAIRNISFAHYAGFGRMGKLLSSPVYLPILFTIPVLWIGAVILFASTPGFWFIRPIVYSNMLPVWAIDSIFLPAVGFALVSTAFGARRFWKAIASQPPLPSTTAMPLSRAVIRTLTGILKHDKMAKCVVNKPRRTAHLLTMYGFIALMITTTLVGIIYWIDKLGLAQVAVTPLALSHPVKVLGNLGALSAVIGVSLIIVRRYGQWSERVSVSGYYDGHFIFMLYGAVVTGILAELARLGDVAMAAFLIYYVHLVIVFVLLVYAPFSKFAHLLYRFMALVISNMAGREVKASKPGGPFEPNKGQ